MWTDPLLEIRTVWQPICDLRSEDIWGYEALTRGPAGTPWEMPAALFELARFERREPELEEAMRRMGMQSAMRDLPQGAVLFANADARFASPTVNPGGRFWPTGRTVLEISERSPLFDEPEALKAQVAAWRAQGYRIALDDFGSGYAGQTALLAVRPDVIKIDAKLVTGIAQDPWRQAMVLSIVRVATALDIAVIAEGIETETERDELEAMGVRFGQGYLFGRPEVTPRGGRLLEQEDAAGPEREALLCAAMPRQGAAYAVDRGRRIVCWNEGAAQLAEMKAPDVVGKTCWLSGLDHRDAFGVRLCFFACPLEATLRTGKPHLGVVSMRVRGAERRWVAMRAAPVRDGEGNIVGAVETFAPSRAPQDIAESELQRDAAVRGASRQPS